MTASVFRYTATVGISDSVSSDGNSCTRRARDATINKVSVVDVDGSYAGADLGILKGGGT